MEQCRLNDLSIPVSARLIAFIIMTMRLKNLRSSGSALGQTVMGWMENQAASKEAQRRHCMTR